MQGTTASVKDLNGKLITDLTVSARSEIVKAIEFIANTDKLPDDLKRLGLLATGSVSRGSRAMSAPSQAKTRY